MDKLPGTLAKMLNLAEEIHKLILQYDPTLIVIEEIAGSKNRLGQKTLDGFHWIVLLTIREYLKRVHFYDVTGAEGWRTNLGLRQSEADKLQNKEAKKLNKRLASSQRLPEVTPKTLAARYAHAKFGMVLDVDQNAGDADIADSLCMGHAFLLFKFAKFQS
jgi:Holliday junction resolvasome RuvABC endonuclease subunit